MRTSLGETPAGPIEIVAAAAEGDDGLEPQEQINGNAASHRSNRTRGIVMDPVHSSYRAVTRTTCAGTNAPLTALQANTARS
jgi:hypothetical protein